MSDGTWGLISEDAAELRVGSPADAQQIAQYLREQDVWREIVPGLASVTVLFDPLQSNTDSVLQALREASQLEPENQTAPLTPLEIPVVYGGEDGPDLTGVCERLGVSEAAFIQAHIAASHKVDMIGFTPGFAYVSGIDPSTTVPRRAAPRPRLPAGSVGISGAYTGLYALAGPGGWPIIGRTDLSLFDPKADDPFLIRPGQKIVFKAV